MIGAPPVVTLVVRRRRRKRVVVGEDMMSDAAAEWLMGSNSGPFELAVKSVQSEKGDCSDQPIGYCLYCNSSIVKSTFLVNPRVSH